MTIGPPGTTAATPSSSDGARGRRTRGRPALDLDEDVVLDATIAALASGGDAAMQEIARRSGVAKTTLNDRFGGKAGLVDRAIQRERRRLADHLVASYGRHWDDTAKAQVEHGFQAFFGYAKTHPAAFSVLFGGAPPSSTEASDEVVEAIANLISSRFAAAGAELEVGAKVIAMVIVGAGAAVARLVTTDGVDPEVMARFVADLIANGLEHLDVGLLFEANAAGRGSGSRGRPR